MTRASDTAKLIGAGATILDGTTISTADNTAQLILQSTDTDASSGPQLTLKRDSSSPADDDFVGRVKYIAENDASQEVTYVDLLSRIKDASDGTEDGEFQIKTMVAGSDLTNFKITSSGVTTGQPEVVINDDSVDMDFRVESNGNANMLFIDGGNDAVGIGNNTAASFFAGARELVVGSGTGNQGMTIFSGASNTGNIKFADATTNDATKTAGGIRYDHTNNFMRFDTNDGSERMRIDSTGAVTMPSQPAFLVQPSTPQSDFGADGNNDVIAFGTERFDQNNDFSSNTFTAPTTGKYQLSVNLYLANIESAANYYQLTLATSNREYFYAFDVSSADSDPNRFTFQVNVLADMDANDTSEVRILQVTGSAQTDIAIESYFSGFLAC
jgi:hypothetical protein